MTLKEKLKTEFPINTEKKSNKFANKCVEIADEFAIGFAFYLSDNYTSRTLDTWDDAVGIRFTTNEVLEIYKKEKGL